MLNRGLIYGRGRHQCSTDCRKFLFECADRQCADKHGNAEEHRALRFVEYRSEISVKTAKILFNTVKKDGDQNQTDCTRANIFFYHHVR